MAGKHMCQLLPCHTHARVCCSMGQRVHVLCAVLCELWTGAMPLAGTLAQAVGCVLLFTHLAIEESRHQTHMGG
jgi:hypothetical protein